MISGTSFCGYLGGESHSGSTCCRYKLLLKMWGPDANFICPRFLEERYLVEHWLRGCSNHAILWQRTFGVFTIDSRRRYFINPVSRDPVVQTLIGVLIPFIWKRGLKMCIKIDHTFRDALFSTEWKMNWSRQASESRRKRRRSLWLSSITYPLHRIQPWVALT